MSRKKAQKAQNVFQRFNCFCPDFYFVLFVPFCG
jgi:hypothetical protein